MALPVLVVEDEEPIRNLIAAYLQRDGFFVLQAADGHSGWQLVQERKPALVILDIMLPGLDGLELCRRIRSVSDAYVILLTAKADETDRIVGLEIGADDYVTKPFSPRELLARVRAAMRRLRAESPTTLLPSNVSEEIIPSPLMIEEASRRVFLYGEEVTFSALEFDLLLTLTRHPEIVLSREQIINLVWGYDFAGDARLVDVHIAQLRKKLGPLAHDWIQTVRGVGYRYAPAARAGKR